jgi:tripartite ATP-independent transporter DctM subunit
MDSLMIAGLAIVAIIVMILLGIPVGVALGVTGFFGFACIGGWSMALPQLQTLPYNLANDYAFAVVPTFVFMGNLAMNGGMAKELYRCADCWFGHYRGGLYLSTIAGSAAFGAASGSTLVNATVFTRLALPEMLRLGYSKRMSSACIAAVGTLAAMIPPSVAMVVYGIVTEQSIGKLMVAGIVPGIISAIAYGILTVIIVTLRPAMAPKRVEKASLRERFSALRGTWAIAVLFFIVIGGIYFGLFSPSTSGAAGAFGALIILLFRRKLTFQIVWDSLVSTAVTTGMLFIIIIGGLLFSRMLVMSGAITSIIEWISTVGLSKPILVFSLCLMYVALGCLTDAVSMLIVTLPFVFPIIKHAGMDPIWFGIICVQLFEIGAMTPPIGLNLYATVSASNSTINMEEIMQGIIPFVLLNFLIITVLIIFPDIILWLPQQMEKF